MSTYCVYLTIYSGKKLPMFYIGSSTIAKIKNEYHGSVSSKEYGKIWKEELRNNPELFRTRIISSHDTREQAFDKEEMIMYKEMVNDVRRFEFYYNWIRVVRFFARGI